MIMTIIYLAHSQCPVYLSKDVFTRRSSDIQHYIS